MTNGTLLIGWKNKMAEIRNWDFHALRFDFSRLARTDGKDKPSDIDMFYVGKDNTLVIGEFKNESRPYISNGQKWLMERFVNGWKDDAIALLIIHDKYVQRGDTTVNVARLYVKEYFWKKVGKWIPPQRKTTVKEVINKYRGGNKMIKHYCDKCGKQFKPVDERKESNDVYLYTMLAEGKDLDNETSIRFELCPDCIRKLYLFIKEGA